MPTENSAFTLFGLNNANSAFAAALQNQYALAYSALGTQNAFAAQNTAFNPYAFTWFTNPYAVPMNQLNALGTNNPFAAFATGLTAANPFAAFTNPFAAFTNPFAAFTNPFAAVASPTISFANAFSTPAASYTSTGGSNTGGNTGGGGSTGGSPSAPYQLSDGQKIAIT